MFGITTESGNTLVQFIGKKKKKGYIYINHDSNYLPVAFEERTGLPINEIEWNFLEPKAGDTFRALDADTIEKVLVAIKKRKELLRLRSLEERQKWVKENAPRKEEEVIQN